MKPTFTIPTLPLDEALALRAEGALLVDVRAPAEFAETTIPGAINVPLLDDDERAIVGTLYKQQGRDIALRRGIELVSPRIPQIVAAVEAALTTPRQPVVVFCWRGGERSRAVTSFLCLAGLQASQLRGGHKVFRRHVLDFFEKGSWGRLLVLRGLTGVGKTRALHELAARGLPVLDLEGLANHRGSAFGALGLPPQPSQKYFEALLWDILRQVPADGYLVSEGESRQIGRLRLPQRLFEALQVETSLWLTAGLAYRAQVVLEDYPVVSRDKDLFAEPIIALKRRLGGERVAALLALLEADRWQELVCALMEEYYDPLYLHTFPARRVEIAIDRPDGLDRLQQAIATLVAATTEGAS